MVARNHTDCCGAFAAYSSKVGGERGSEDESCDGGIFSRANAKPLRSPLTDTGGVMAYGVSMGVLPYTRGGKCEMGRSSSDS